MRDMDDEIAESLRGLIHRTDFLHATDQMLSERIRLTQSLVKVVMIAGRQQRAIDLLVLASIAALSLLVIDLHWNVCETWVDYVFFFLGPFTATTYGVRQTWQSFRRGAEVHAEFKKAQEGMNAAFAALQEIEAEAS